MKFPLCLTHRKQTASFRIAGSMLAIASLWLMLAAANTSAYAQTSDNVSNATATTTPAPSPADWTEFHRDNMQRWNPYETVLGVGNFGSLGVKWIGFHVDNSSPAVANGVEYVGADVGSLYALNASTGAKLWSYTTGGNVSSSPAVANGVVYIGSNDGNIYALNANTGAKLWSYTTGGEVDSSPAVVNGVVYIGSFDGNVYALNASTGALLWSYPTAQAFPVESSPAVANGVVYVGTDRGVLYALNASTGAQLWSAGIAYAVSSSPAVANGVVYVGGFLGEFGGPTGSVVALNASTGAGLWTFLDTEGIVASSPAVANGVVYISDVGNYCCTGNLYALNASTGALLWSYNTGGGYSSSPAVANGVVYVGTDYGTFYALNASTGALLWSYYVGGAESSPAIVDGVVYIGAGDLYAFSSASANNADLFLRIRPTLTTVHQGDLLTYAFPVWNLGPNNAYLEVLNTQVPAGTTFDYIRISGTPGLGTCTTPLYGGTGSIVCHQNNAMALNTTWTVRLTVKVTAPAGTVITESAATMADNPDPNLANNKATVSLTVVP